MTTKYQKYGVPYSLTIEEFKYTYKEYHPNNDLFTYRCIHRSCKAYIKIKKNEIDKISFKSDNKKISYINMIIIKGKLYQLKKLLLKVTKMKKN